MNKVYMIEYQGRCDEEKNAVGHAPKVLTEYYNFIQDYCDVTVLAPQVVLDSVVEKDSMDTVVLPRHIMQKGHISFFEKIKNKFNMFKNISESIRYANQKESGILWFFNVEYYILLYFLVHKKPSHKIYFTMFTDGYFSSSETGLKGRIVNIVKQVVFEKAQKKLDFIISSGPKFKYKKCDSVFIPDYTFDTNLLDYYPQKTEIAVCLGTMDKGKQLEEMIRAFTRINYKLVIAGRFYDKEYLAEMQAIAGANITISDMYLSNEQYHQMMSNAKYTVLPYSKEKYTHQTSGVLQEALFADTIPITYDAILKANGIPGIGFFSWDSLNEPMLYADPTRTYAKFYDLKNTVYSKAQIAEIYKTIFT